VSGRFSKQDGKAQGAPKRAGYGPLQQKADTSNRAASGNSIAKHSGSPGFAHLFYSLRHTFLTRLGESGCDTWTLARIAGHSSIAISARYVHPSEDAVLMAVERLSGHKTGHTQKVLVGTVQGEGHVTARQESG